MSRFEITYEADLPEGERGLVPAGIQTPHGACGRVEVNGAILDTPTEAHGGQSAHVVTEGKRAAWP